MEGAHPRTSQIAGNPDALQALQDRTANVVGGTPWLRAREELLHRGRFRIAR